MDEQRKPPKGLPSLSRNLLVIIAEYLQFVQVLNLASSQWCILEKLDDRKGNNGLTNPENGSYIKKRGILYSQTFFF